MLLTRKQFKEQVFRRDNTRCVVCNNIAKDAHHIIDRSLFEDGGYYLNNGVSLCNGCHIEAERTLISVSYLRNKIGLTNPKDFIIPPHLDRFSVYDKWGNTILQNGTRLKGELFYQENVQKVLKEANLLNSFQKYVKFSRTYHFDWSENLQNDDRKLTSIEQFNNREVIATIKLDGENTSAYPDFIHARSIDSKDHESRHWIKSFHSTFKYEIPENWIFCGENLFAKHSIHYNNLESYFYLFAIYNEKMTNLSWDEICEWCELLNLKHVPVFYRGKFDKDLIHNEFLKYVENSKDEVEGYVVRITDSFHYNDYNKFVGKYVRKNHVKSSNHWLKEEIVKNNLKV